MNYQTRHLEALTEIPRGTRLVLVGERFEASEVDANHYLTRQMAKDAPPPAPPAEKRQPEADAARRPGRPSNAELAARAAKPAEPVKPVEPLVQTTANSGPIVATETKTD